MRKVILIAFSGFLLLLSGCSKEVYWLTDPASLQCLEGQGSSQSALEGLGRARGVDLKVVQTEPGSVQRLHAGLSGGGATVLLSPLMARFVDEPDEEAIFPTGDGISEASIGSATRAMLTALREEFAGADACMVAVKGTTSQSLARGKEIQQIIEEFFPEKSVELKIFEDLDQGQFLPALSELRGTSSLVIFVGEITDSSVLKELAYSNVSHIGWFFPGDIQPWDSCLGSFVPDLTGQFEAILDKISTQKKKNDPIELVKFKAFT